METSVLFLDDNRGRRDTYEQKYGWVYDQCDIVTTASMAIQSLYVQDRNGGYDKVSLDHDLNDEVFVDPRRPDSGMAVVRWIVENKPKIKQIVIHSANAFAAPKMRKLLMQAGYECTAEPFEGAYNYAAPLGYAGLFDGM